MSDFSAFALFVAGLAAFAPFTAAYTQPVGDSPKGNPISLPGLGSIVPVGSPYTVTWDPTTEGTVTLLLLKGPSTNAVPQYPIAEAIPNSGSFVWTPASDLAPSDASTPAQGYGIQLIVDSNGQYQYTTQFGISNANYGGESSSSSSETSTPTASAPGYGSSSSSTPSAPGYGSSSSSSTPSAPAYHTTTSTPVVVAPTYPAQNSTIIPTGYAPPSTLSSTPSAYTPGPTSTLTPYTGSAAKMASSFGGLVLAAGVAVLAF